MNRMRSVIGVAIGKAEATMNRAWIGGALRYQMARP
jgi:hypothetical protein